MKIAHGLLILGLLWVFPASAQPKDGGPKPATPVVVAQAKAERFVDRVEALGTLRANESVTLTAAVSETVTAVNFEDGQRVEKGAVLAEMTSGEEAALLEEERSTVREASRQLERLKPLAEAGAASQSLVDERRREYETAKARLGALESRLQDRLVTAPFSGVLGLRNISVGALVQPGTMLTTLDDDSVMKLDFSVPSVFLPTLKTGLPVTAKARAYEGQEFKGEIVSIDSRIDSMTRSVMVRALIANEDRALKPGLLMTIDLFKNPRDAIVIPEDALIAEGGEVFVLVVDPAAEAPSPEKRKITTGTRRPGDVEVTSGLEAGEHVITRGTMTARPGEPVKITAIETGKEPLADLLNKNEKPAEDKVEENKAGAGK